MRDRDTVGDSRSPHFDMIWFREVSYRDIRSTWISLVSMSNPVGPKAAERGECSKRAKKADRRRHFAVLFLSLSLSLFRRSSFYDLDRSELAVVVGFQSGSARGGSAAVMAVPVELDNSAGVSCWKYVIRPLFVERHRARERGRESGAFHPTHNKSPSLLLSVCLAAAWQMLRLTKVRVCRAEWRTQRRRKEGRKGGDAAVAVEMLPWEVTASESRSHFVFFRSKVTPPPVPRRRFVRSKMGRSWLESHLSDTF